MDRVSRPSITNVPLVVLTIASALVVLRLGADIFGPVLLSVLLSYALGPAVSALTRIRIPRVAAAAAVYAILAVALWTTSAAGARQVDAFVDDLPRSGAALRQRLGRAHLEGRGPLSRLSEAARGIQQAIQGRKRPPRSVKPVAPVNGRFNVRAVMFQTGTHLLSAGARLFFVALLTFLLLASGDLYKRKLIKLAGRRLEDRKVTLDVIQTIDRQIERYLAIRLLISAIVAVLTAAGLLWIGVAHAVVWGTIAGVLNVIPFIGPTVACGLIALAALLQFQSFEVMLAAGAMSVGVAALEGNVLTPWLAGRAGELNTVAVFVSVLFWGWLWDVWGLLLAVPITVAVKAAADHIEPLQPLGELLGP